MDTSELALAGKRIVLIESPDHRTAYEAIRRITQSGARVTLVSSDPDMYLNTRKVAWNPLSAVSASIKADTTSAAAVLAALSAAPKAERRWSGCLTFSDYHAETAAAVAYALGLPGPDPEVVRMAKHKDRLRERLRGTSFAVPHVLVTASGDLPDAAACLGFPLVAKPTAAGGSIGVFLARDRRELENAYRAISAMRATSRGNALDGHVLLEQYLEGPEYSVETLTWQGHTHVYGILRKELHSEYRFTELAHSFPALEDTADGPVLKGFVTELLAFLGFSEGAAHTEVKMTAAGPRLVELNPRLLGEHGATLLRLVCDTDPYVHTMLVATGARPGPGSPRPDRGAALAALTAGREGCLRSIKGVAEAREMPGVEFVDMYRQVGEMVHPPVDNREYLGYVCATSHNARSARALAASAVDKITFDIYRDDRE